jgi:hypothetical protein
MTLPSLGGQPFVSISFLVYAQNELHVAELEPPFFLSFVALRPLAGPWVEQRSQKRKTEEQAHVLASLRSVVVVV